MKKFNVRVKKTVYEMYEIEAESEFEAELKYDTKGIMCNCYDEIEKAEVNEIEIK